MKDQSAGKRELRKRIAAYCLAAAGSAGVAAPASAAIVYTDLNPDQTYTPSNTTTLDLNGDSTNDLLIPFVYWSTGGAEVYGLSSAGILRTSIGNDKALALNKGYSIGPGVSASFASRPDFWTVTGTQVNGNWPGASHKYLGVRIPIGGGSYQYAWVEVSAASARNSITIHGYAYETEADTPIPAGSVPEPSGLALFALGAAGVVAWRRRQKKRAEKGPSTTPA